MTKHDKHAHHEHNKDKEPVETPETVAAEPVIETVEPVAEPEMVPAPLLEAALKDAMSWKEKHQYLAAEYATFRTRAARERQEAQAAGVANAVGPILDVFDTFRMAMTASEQTDNIEKVREGLSHILNAFNKSIADLGIEPVEALDQAFDPNLHEAISTTPSDKPEGTVVQQWSCGYKLNGKLLRPARVIVSAGKPE